VKPKPEAPIYSDAGRNETKGGVKFPARPSVEEEEIANTKSREIFDELRTLEF